MSRVCYYLPLYVRSCGGTTAALFVAKKSTLFLGRVASMSHPFCFVARRRRDAAKDKSLQWRSIHQNAHEREVILLPDVRLVAIRTPDFFFAVSRESLRDVSSQQSLFLSQQLLLFVCTRPLVILATNGLTQMLSHHILDPLSVGR